MEDERVSPARKRAQVWWVALLIVFAISVPAYAAHANNGTRARGNNATLQANATSGPGTPADQHAFKPMICGSWGPNGHQPNPNSSPQGKSMSDPDGSSNGGADKPGGSGGCNSDQDGNNGCGNDSDREDDNNGWCGLKPKPTHTPEVSPSPSVSASVVPTVIASSSPTASATGGTGAVVLGERVSGSGATVLGRVLSRTGSAVVAFLFAGLVLLGIGIFVRVRSRRARA